MGALFRFDFNSPYAYLAAMRIDDVLGEDVTWQPIAFGFLLHAQQRVPWSLQPGREAGMADCEQRAAAYGLKTLQWPDGWPRESWSLVPLRAAVAAGRAGAMKEFTRAAYTRWWADGESLHDIEVLVAAGADAGLDAAVIRDGVQDPSVSQQLKQDTDSAFTEGVPGVPTVTVGGEHFWGDDRLPAAAVALSAAQ